MCNHCLLPRAAAELSNPFCGAREKSYHAEGNFSRRQDTKIPGSLKTYLLPQLDLHAQDSLLLLHISPC